MVQYVKQGDIFGRIGEEVGKGLSEAIPKEVERLRLAQGLKDLGQQKNLTPFQQYTGLLSVPGVLDRPQVQQTAGDVLRQQAIIDSVRNGQKITSDQDALVREQIKKSSSQPHEGLKTATTPESSQAKLKPVIPPSGAEQERMARQKFANEPLIYPTLDAARSAVSNEIAGNVAQSNALINKGELEKGVQSEAEQKLRDQIQTLGAEIPGNSLGRLQQKAVDAVANGELSTDEAKIEYGKEADKLSRDFAKIRSYGGIDLITNKPKDLFNAIKSIREKNPDREVRRDMADTMVGENGLSPQFAYAQMLPVSETPELNQELKKLPSLQPKATLRRGFPEAEVNPEEARKATQAIAPQLLKSMGNTGSPLSVAYELEKKNYDPEVWKDYLLKHKGELTGDQFDELGLTQKGFSGWLNDWWFKSFTGIE